MDCYGSLVYVVVLVNEPVSDAIKMPGLVASSPVCRWQLVDEAGYPIIFKAQFFITKFTYKIFKYIAISNRNHASQINVTNRKIMLFSIRQNYSNCIIRL